MDHIAQFLVCLSNSVLLCYFMINAYVYLSSFNHYENVPMPYTEIFKVVKMKIFSGIFLLFFLFLLKT